MFIFSMTLVTLFFKITLSSLMPQHRENADVSRMLAVDISEELELKTVDEEVEVQWKYFSRCLKAV